MVDYSFSSSSSAPGPAATHVIPKCSHQQDAICIEKIDVTIARFCVFVPVIFEQFLSSILYNNNFFS